MLQSVYVQFTGDKGNEVKCLMKEIYMPYGRISGRGRRNVPNRVVLPLNSVMIAIH